MLTYDGNPKSAPEIKLTAVKEHVKALQVSDDIGILLYPDVHLSFIHVVSAVDHSFENGCCADLSLSPTTSSLLYGDYFCSGHQDMIEKQKEKELKDAKQVMLPVCYICIVKLELDKYTSGFSMSLTTTTIY